jgi:hypothetical protein
LPLLRERLQPVAKPDAERVKRAIADLDSGDFKVRDRAARELEQLDELAEPAMQAALERGPSLEVRRRIEALMAKWANTASAPERLRGIRAVLVLEMIGSAEARRILETLASGATGATLTREAAASSRRLADRAADVTR